MRLDPDIIPRLFELAGPTNSHYPVITNTYDFVSRQSQRLCVTVGESWTYGSDLEDRVGSVYGNHLSTKLDSDWLNLAIPGAGNHWMAHMITQLAQVQLDYDEIYVFCTLTEVGRQLDCQYDCHIDFLDWRRKQDVLQFDRFAEMLNRDCLDIIHSHAPVFTRLILGSTFVDPIGFDSEHWLGQIMPVTGECYSVQHGLDRLIVKIPELLQLDQEENLRFKEWACEMVDKGHRRAQYMATPGIMKNWHPCMKQYHDIWANYLFSRL